MIGNDWQLKKFVLRCLIIRGQDVAELGGLQRFLVIVMKRKCCFLTKKEDIQEELFLTFYPFIKQEVMHLGYYFFLTTIYSDASTCVS